MESYIYRSICAARQFFGKNENFYLSQMGYFRLLRPPWIEENFIYPAAHIDLYMWDSNYFSLELISVRYMLGSYNDQYMKTYILPIYDYQIFFLFWTDIVRLNTDLDNCLLGTKPVLNQKFDQEAEKAITAIEECKKACFQNSFVV